MSRALPRLAAVAALLLAALPVRAQFGQNKVSYSDEQWKVYPSPHFDVHYYPAVEPFLEQVVSYAESAYLKISRDLDHELRFRVPLIVYKTHGEFQQTNISLQELPEGVEAFAEPFQYRMVLPIDQPPDKLYELIAHELTHIFEYSLFYEGYIGRALRSRAPLWMMEGLASYLGQDEDNLDRMVIRDAVVNGVLPPIQDLDVLNFLTYRYGHAIFDYIEQEHGKEGLRNFLFEYKKVLLGNNLPKAIKETFGYDVDEFNRRFNRYLRRKYFPVLLEKKSPDDYGKEIGIKRPGVFTFSPTLSPSGELVAALTNRTRLELDLVVLSAEEGSKVVRSLTPGTTNRYRELVAEAFAGKRDLSWSPQADQVAVFARRENKWPLLVFNALNGHRVYDIEFDNIFECASPVFAPDGRHIAFEGNRDGVVDIFEVDLETREVRNLTQDDFFDANPWYSADGKSLLYNRRIGAYWKIFSVDRADSAQKTQLTFGTASDLQPSYSRDGKRIYFTSDRGAYGVFNIHSLDLQSGAVQQYTDVVGGCFAPAEMAAHEGKPYLVFTAYFEGTFRLYRMALGTPEAQVEPAEAGQAAEAQPFESALQLKVDEEKKHDYKVKWDLESPGFSVGVADDGTFLADVTLQFSDLLGDQRFIISGASVSDFASYNAIYLNLKHRLDWGARAYDVRDYFLTQTAAGLELQQGSRETGAYVFAQYPFNRYYRVEGSVGAVDSSQTLLTGFVDPGTGIANPVFDRVSDRLATVGLDFVGDTTRYQRFGPFQGKRFDIGAFFGKHLAGDFEGDLLEYQLDFRAYKKLTRRSLLAWRLASRYNAGDRFFTYGFGGLNQLRGFGFRSFAGSRIAWSNLELRFPLVDVLQFPVLPITGIRGFFFLDVGAAWFQDGLWYDPVLGGIRVDASNTPIEFEFWDSDESRLRDGRASYGAGFQFLFIGGLQFNWIWARQLPYTQFLPSTTGELVPQKADTSGTRTEFYIAFDF